MGTEEQRPRGAERAPQAEPQQNTHIRARTAGSPWRGGSRNRAGRTPGWGVCASEGVWALEVGARRLQSRRDFGLGVCFGKLTLMCSRRRVARESGAREPGGVPSGSSAKSAPSPPPAPPQPRSHSGRRSSSNLCLSCSLCVPCFTVGPAGPVPRDSQGTRPGMLPVHPSP